MLLKRIGVECLDHAAADVMSRRLHVLCFLVQVDIASSSATSNIHVAIGRPYTNSFTCQMRQCTPARHSPAVGSFITSMQREQLED